MTETWRLFRKYYGSAGVSMHWLKSIAPMIKGADLWQTGGDLIDAKTGIIMHALGDTIERATAPAAVETDQASDREVAAKEPRASEPQSQNQTALSATARSFPNRPCNACSDNAVRRERSARRELGRLFRPRLRAWRGRRRGCLRRRIARSVGCAVPIAGLCEPGTDLGDLAQIEQRVVRRSVMIEHADIDLAVIRKRADERNRRRHEGEVTG